VLAETRPKPRAALPDDCAEVPGRPAPEPLARPYSGVAAKARCQREVYTIMGGLTHFLGVKCAFCHVEPNYEIMTHEKRVANWMARELIPRLEKRGGGEVWCNDCHGASGRGERKILKDPRSEAFAVDWMTTHLVQDFSGRGGALLRCKTCHKANLGSPGFQRKIILADASPEPQPDVAVDGGAETPTSPGGAPPERSEDHAAPE
jgi:hypothetical protein